MLDLYTFLPALPDRQRWQAAIDENGVDLQLDPELDLTVDEGFSPCQLNGLPSGFELQVSPASEVLLEYPSAVIAAGTLRHSICFRWGGDFAEAACVFAANLALAKKFGGIAYYPEDDIVYQPADLEEELRACLAEI